MKCAVLLLAGAAAAEKSGIIGFDGKEHDYYFKARHHRGAELKANLLKVVRAHDPALANK